LGGEFASRQKFVLAANQALTVEAVLKLLKAAAGASEQTISSSMVRLLAKLSVHADQGSGPIRESAHEAMRENVEELIRGWELRDPNPESYTLILDRLARTAPVLSPGTRKGHVAGTVRLLQMGLELDAVGPLVEKALIDLMDEGRVSQVLEVLDRSPGGSQLAGQLMAMITRPEWIARAAAGSELDEEGLAELASRIGSPAIEPLLHALTESDSRTVRRKVFECLTRMGPEVGPAAVERLTDPRWFVKRNMLGLIDRMDPLPGGFSALDFLTHEDERVRREAFPVAVRQSGNRARALQLAVGDSDERLARMGLLEARNGMPPGLDGLVRKRFLEDGELPDLHPLAIRILVGSRSPETRDLLLRVCARRSLLGRLRIADPDPEVLAALWVLAKNWSGDPSVSSVLGLARSSSEDAIRTAAHGRE
jgi:hypothetical protein